MRATLLLPLLALWLAPLTLHAKPKAPAGPAVPAALLTGWKVVCADPAHCSPSVGQIAVKLDNGEYQDWCTFSLITSRHVITAAHCLPAAIRKTGVSCTASYWFRFAEDSAYASEPPVLRCKKVLYLPPGYKPYDRREPGKALNFDYAVLELLDESRRPTLPISREGLAHDEEFESYVVDPAQGDQPPTQRYRRCRAEQRSKIWPNVYDDRRSPAVASFTCPSMGGNSGAPQLGLDGTIRSIHDASQKEGQYDPEAIFYADVLKRDKEWAPHARVGASLACNILPPEIKAPPMPAACEALADDVVGAEKFYAQSIPLRLLPRSRLPYPWQKTAAQYLRFEISWEIGKEFRIFPRCLLTSRVPLGTELPGVPKDYEISRVLDENFRPSDYVYKVKKPEPASFRFERSEGGFYFVTFGDKTWRVPLCANLINYPAEPK